MSLKRITISNAMQALLSVFAMVVLLVIAVSGASSELLFVAFAIGTLFVMISFLISSRYILSTKPHEELKEVEKEGKNEEEIDPNEKLSALDEAALYFSASLKPDDMFRLVASRTSEIVPHDVALLFVVEDELLKAKYTAGKEGRRLGGIELELDKGIAGRAISSGKGEIEKQLNIESRYYDPDAISGFQTAAAIALRKGGVPFAVLALFRRDSQFDEQDRVHLELVGARVASLVASSFAFEQSLMNSMTDSLTQLPNERAFYVVLENRIEEAIRFPEQRGLTVMVIDVKDFADFNRKYGHTEGDELLAFSAGLIQDELRKMDMLCRSMSDEFWVVLPTSSEKIVEKIKRRLVARAADTPFITHKETKYEVVFNFGSSVFMEDGETPNDLLQKAVIRKKEGGLKEEPSVINFPKEYVN